MPMTIAQHETTNIGAAFEMLIEEVEADIDFVNRQGANALEGRDYDRARNALERAAQITAFREKLDNLRREWTQVAGTKETEDEETRQHRGNLGRLGRGLRTPEQEYYRPILQTLEELGGSAPLSDVLERVRELMDGSLRDVDFEQLASNPDMQRWRNAAQWARNAMVREGLLKNDSQRGIWEISDVGRRHLQEQAP